jgi:hypothetical protein
MSCVVVTQESSSESQSQRKNLRQHLRQKKAIEQGNSQCYPQGKDGEQGRRAGTGEGRANETYLQHRTGAQGGLDLKNMEQRKRQRRQKN